MTKKEEQIIKDIRELVDKYWSFDNNQIHTHSWHDKQDCLEQIDHYLSNHPTEQKQSCDNCGDGPICKCGEYCIDSRQMKPAAAIRASMKQFVKEQEAGS